MFQVSELIAALSRTPSVYSQMASRLKKARPDVSSLTP